MAHFPSRLRATGGGKKQRRRGRIAALALIIAVLAVGVTARSSDRLKEAVAPPATFSIATPEPRTAEEQQYLDAILPLTERLIGEGRLLSELGAARSRNIIELRTRAERFRDAADAVVQTEFVLGVPLRLEPFSASLNRGITSALAAIAEAEGAVVRFDWDQVGVAVSTFTTAIDVIASAIDTLEHP